MRVSQDFSKGVLCIVVFKGKGGDVGFMSSGFYVCGFGDSLDA